MKLRYLMLALLSMLTATALTAQTMTASNVAAKTRTARSVIKDVRNKNVGRASSTVLADKDVARYVKVDKDLHSRVTDPKFVSDLRKAPAQIRKNPVAFAKKHEKTMRDLKKHRPKWLGGKGKKRTTKKS